MLRRLLTAADGSHDHILKYPADQLEQAFEQAALPPQPSVIRPVVASATPAFLKLLTGEPSDGNETATAHSSGSSSSSKHKSIDFSPAPTADPVKPKPKRQSSLRRALSATIGHRRATSSSSAPQVVA